MKDPRDDPASGHQLEGHRALRLQQRAELRRERKYTPLTILGLSGIEPYFTGGEIDLPPFQPEDLARDPPARHVGERDDRAKMSGEMRDHRQVLFRKRLGGSRVRFAAPRI